MLLLEAGTETHPLSRVPVGISKMIDRPAVNWCYSSEPDEGSGGRRIEVPRGKMMGGSSSINGMVWVRGQRQDYDHWAQLGNRGWSYQDVLPIFKAHGELRGRRRRHPRPRRADEGLRHRRERPLLRQDHRRRRNVGLQPNPDHNGANQEGVGMSQVTIAGAGA